MEPRLPRGLYAIADAGFGEPVALGIALVEAGCRVVQLRAKGWSGDAVANAAEALLAVTRPAGALLIVNDHPKVAAEVGADGVHLGQEDPPFDLDALRRSLRPGALIGRSTRTLEQVAAAQDADYLGFGPVFATDTRPGLPPPRGVDMLAAAVRASTRPVVAIGGIDLDRLSEVRRAGPWGWAVISALLRAPNLAAAVLALSEDENR